MKVRRASVWLIERPGHPAYFVHRPLLDRRGSWAAGALAGDRFATQAEAQAVIDDHCRGLMEGTGARPCLLMASLSVHEYDLWRESDGGGDDILIDPDDVGVFDKPGRFYTFRRRING